MAKEMDNEQKQHDHARKQLADWIAAYNEDSSHPTLLSLDDIARAEGLDFDELIDKLDDIVDSGTKLNIDYYLDDTYDEDQIDDIYDYFMESDTDDIDKAMDELNEDYTEEEIRLVRIQFISEMAN